MFKLPIPDFFKTRRENTDLKAKMRRLQNDFGVERTVLIDAITQHKHVIGVQSKLFSGMDQFGRSLPMLQSSLSHLMNHAIRNPKYALVAELEMVKVEHLVFRMSVYRAFLAITHVCNVGENCEPAQPEAIASYSESMFGKWYYTAQPRLNMYTDFQAIDAPHRRMHLFAAEALELFAERQYLEGVDKVTIMEQSSIEVMTSLNALATRLMEVAQNEDTNAQNNARSVDGDLSDIIVPEFAAQSSATGDSGSADEEGRPGAAASTPA